MTLKKSTRLWFGVFAISIALAIVLSLTRGKLGFVGLFFAIIATCSGLYLSTIGIVALFRRIVRRIALRLTFSYFLIGVVPIPMLAALLFVVGYVLASQIVGARLRWEVLAFGESAGATQKGLPSVRVRDRVVVGSDVEWLRPGDPADWAERLVKPEPLIVGENIWLAARSGDTDPARIALVSFDTPPGDSLQRLADRTGYEIRLSTGREEHRRAGYEIRAGRGHEGEWRLVARPRSARVSDGSWLSREWLVGVSVERPAAVIGGSASDKRLVVFVARTSPHVLFDQLFAQGAPEVGRVFWGIIAGLATSLLLVYLVALAIAFFLIASIARSVNRLTRAADAVSGGDFSVRIQSKSRDQIGDLARSFDGMASSIQRLLVQTAEKERLEGEIAVAHTIQQKLLPPPEAELPGLDLLVHFQPVAAIGGDYYDYFSMPDGRTAVAIGDVSGHGLPTGLLVAMAKAALTTQIESGLKGSELFARLNDLIYRSTDNRNYMTLALCAYDSVACKVELTNAGQLAPYRLSAGQVSSLTLPSFPLGAAPRGGFPSASYELARGDRLLFLTDGLVEAAGTDGEPFGFERLEDLLRAEAASDSRRLREAVLSAVATYSADAPPTDDRTLVILTVLQVGGA